MTTFIIASSNMGKIKAALGYRPKFHNGNDWDVQVDLSEPEHSLVLSKLSDDKHFVIKEYRINMFCC